MAKRQALKHCIAAWAMGVLLLLGAALPAQAAPVVADELAVLAQRKAQNMESAVRREAGQSTATAAATAPAVPANWSVYPAPLSEARGLAARHNAAIGLTSAPDRLQLVPPVYFGGVKSEDIMVLFNADNRFRAESRRNYDGKNATKDDDQWALYRTRASLDATYLSFARVFVEAMDSRVIGQSEERGQVSPAELHQAFLELADPLNQPWSIRVGKQEILLGRDRRLVNVTNWNNLRRTFYGGRLMYRTRDLDADLFYGVPSYFERERHGDVMTGAARPLDGVAFYGGYSIFRGIPGQTIESYALGQSDRNPNRVFPNVVQSENGDPGTIDRFTVGSNIYGPIHRSARGTLAYDLEAAYQFGHRSSDVIRSYMGHADLSYEWNMKWRPRIMLEGNLGSGDRDRGDGQVNAFNPLYGRAGIPFGRIDFFRLQNMRELVLSGSVQPKQNVRGLIEVHQFWLDSTNDNWVDTRGTALGGGKSARLLNSTVGREIDAVLSWRMNRVLTVELGAAYFMPDDFSSGVGRPDRSSLIYLQTCLNF